MELEKGKFYDIYSPKGRKYRGCIQAEHGGVIKYIGDYFKLHPKDLIVSHKSLTDYGYHQVSSTSVSWLDLKRKN